MDKQPRKEEHISDEFLAELMKPEIEIVVELEEEPKPKKQINLKQMESSTFILSMPILLLLTVNFL